MYTPPVTPWELEAPEVSDLTVRKELPKVKPATGVKSYQGSRIGRCGWITSFLREKIKGNFCCQVLREQRIVLSKIKVKQVCCGLIAQPVRARA